MILFEGTGTFTSVYHKIVEMKLFLTIFCLLMPIEGSGALQNNGRSGWPKNTRIWIRIQIPNTDKNNTGNKW